MLSEKNENNLYKLFIGFNRYLIFRDGNPNLLSKEVETFIDLFFNCLCIKLQIKDFAMISKLEKQEFLKSLDEWAAMFYYWNFPANTIETIVDLMQGIQSVNFQYVKTRIAQLYNGKENHNLYSYQPETQFFFFKRDSSQEDKKYYKIITKGKCCKALFNFLVQTPTIMTLCSMDEKNFFNKLNSIEENISENLLRRWSKFRCLLENFHDILRDRLSVQKANSYNPYSTLSPRYLPFDEERALYYIKEFFTFEGKLETIYSEILKKGEPFPSLTRKK